MAMRSFLSLIIAAVVVSQATADQASKSAGVKPRQGFAKDHIMLQASVEQKKSQAMKLTKTQPAKPPKLSETEKAEACSRMGGDDNVCANPDAPDYVSPATKGSSRVQIATTIKKVVLDLE